MRGSCEAKQQASSQDKRELLLRVLTQACFQHCTIATPFLIASFLHSSCSWLHIERGPQASHASLAAGAGPEAAFVQALASAAWTRSLLTCWAARAAQRGAAKLQRSQAEDHARQRLCSTAWCAWGASCLQSAQKAAAWESAEAHHRRVHTLQSFQRSASLPVLGSWLCSCTWLLNSSWPALAPIPKLNMVQRRSNRYACWWVMCMHTSVHDVRLTALAVCSLRRNVRHRQAKAQTARMVAGLRKLHAHRRAALVMAAWRLAHQVLTTPWTRALVCMYACMSVHVHVRVGVGVRVLVLVRVRTWTAGVLLVMSCLCNLRDHAAAL